MLLQRCLIGREHHFFLDTDNTLKWHFRRNTRLSGGKLLGGRCCEETAERERAAKVVVDTILS